MTELKTIDELMAGKKPGEIKILNEKYWGDEWGQPFFRDHSGLWHGLDKSQDYVRFVRGEAGWKLYEEE